jgi:hypothetical protein
MRQRRFMLDVLYRPASVRRMPSPFKWDSKLLILVGHFAPATGGFSSRGARHQAAVTGFVAVEFGLGTFHGAT